jgi:hypothetical protein
MSDDELHDCLEALTGEANIRLQDTLAHMS